MPTPSTNSSNDLIYERRVTSVVPAKVTGEGRAHQLSHLDISYKSKNVTGLYIFENTGLKDSDFKVPMFEWLVHYGVVCGRIRVGEETGGEMVIKMNDAGIRVIEARARVSVVELLEMNGEERWGCEEGLVPGRGEIGDADDLSFSPLVFIQMTWFKCGGVSLGLNWAHILGDIFSASAFMNVLGQFLKGQYPTKPLQMPRPNNPTISNSRAQTSNVDNQKSSVISQKFKSYSFRLDKVQLEDIRSIVMYAKDFQLGYIQPFQLITALMWKTIATIRAKSKEPRAVTICKNGMGDGHEREKSIPYNGLDGSTVQVDFSVAEVDLSRLVSAITEQTIEESNINELNIGANEAYGEQLTFLDVGGANVYGFEIEGQGPRYVNYSINGVGEGGVVLVIPASKLSSDDKSLELKLVTVVLPEAEVEELKILLGTRWNIQ